MDESKLQQLLDKAEIMDTMSDFALGLGLPDFARYTSAFADEIEVYIPHHLGPEVQKVGAEDFGRRIAEFQGKFQARFHLQSGHKIELDGDGAKVTALQMFRFTLPTDHGGSWYMGGGVVHLDLVRTDRGWKIARLHNDVTWDDGNWSIFKRARGSLEE